MMAACKINHLGCLILTSLTLLSGFMHRNFSSVIEATGELEGAGLCGCLERRVYSPGRSRRDAAAGPAGVQAEVGDRPHTAGPALEGSLDTVLVHSGKDLNNFERSLQNAAHLNVWGIRSNRAFSNFTFIFFVICFWNVKEIKE